MTPTGDNDGHDIDVITTGRRDRSASASREPTSPRSPLAPYPSQPAESKSRAPEYYGFVAWISTYALFVLYLLWALLPDAWIVRMGIEWYPSREWSILLPAYSVVLILLTYFVYWALALYNTPSLNDLSTIVDSLSHVPASEYRTPREDRNPAEKTSEGAAGGAMPSANVYLAAASPTAIPEVFDIPISLVNRILYTRQPSSSTVNQYSYYDHTD